MVTIFAVLSSFYALKSIKRLFQTGTSKDLRNLLAWRTLSQWLYFILASADTLIIYLLKLSINNDRLSVLQENIRFVILTSLSMLAILVRVKEPYVLMTLKELFRYKKINKQNYSELSLNSFINSAMNVEFVCLILKGVRTCEQNFKDS